MSRQISCAETREPILLRAMADQGKDFRRNFSIGVLNGMLFNAALAFLSGSTILPVFISQLTDSRVLIGLFSTLESFGWFSPQLFAAAFIAHRRKVLGFYNNLSSLRLAFFALAIGGIFVFSDNPKLILIAFATGFTLLSIAAGFAGVAFTEIVGKTIPVTSRGSYFGLRMFLGGAVAAIEGLAVKRVISGFEFPYNFGYLYLAAFVLMFFGLAVFYYIREPEAREVIEQAGPKEQIKSALAIFKTDGNFRRLFFSRAWVNTYYLSSPFYVVYAISRLGANEAIAGVYLTAQMSGYLSSNILWAWLSNHISNKRVILLATAFSILPPFLSFLTVYFPVSPLSFALVFFLLGSAEAGIGMGYVNYLLEILPERGRLLSIGLMHTLIAPTVFFSALGGYLSQVFSLKVLFAVVALTTLVSFLISWKLHEPRTRGIKLVMPDKVIE